MNRGIRQAKMSSLVPEVSVTISCILLQYLVFWADCQIIIVWYLFPKGIALSSVYVLQCSLLQRNNPLAVSVVLLPLILPLLLRLLLILMLLQAQVDPPLSTDHNLICWSTMMILYSLEKKLEEIQFKLDLHLNAMPLHLFQVNHPILRQQKGQTQIPLKNTKRITSYFFSLMPHF